VDNNADIKGLTEVRPRKMPVFVQQIEKDNRISKKSFFCLVTYASQTVIVVPFSSSMAAWSNWV